jgi:inorganic phosphate transporter, PiT family
VFISHGAIAFGTLFGGWRIVKTMGSKITKLTPSDGFCAETAGGLTLLLTAFGGIAVSTTHTIAGAIMGVGATKRLSAVRWGVAGTMIWAWLLTIPASAAVAAAAYLLIEAVRSLFG